ncbi:MAG: peptidase M15 [Nitrospirae bacterium]|nr:peptidase M15 [Nitrospirota bacterium]
MDLSYQVSPHFTFGELVVTENRLLMVQNQIDAESHLDKLQLLCQNVLEPIRSLLGQTVVLSGYRNLALNKSIGGSITSQHLDGEAADTVYYGISLKKAFNEIAFSQIPYSQIIFEFGKWVHVGVIDEILHPGKVGQKFISDFVNGETVYTLVTKPLV